MRPRSALPQGDSIAGAPFTPRNGTARSGREPAERRGCGHGPTKVGPQRPLQGGQVVLHPPTSAPPG